MPLVFPSLLWRVATPAQEVYLTFDDGPVYGPTEFVLDELKKRDARATFFCIGDNVRKHPDVFRRIIDAGHSIGNHTFSHVDGWKTTTHHYLENIQRFNDGLSAFDCRQPSIFRPPYGKITRSQIRALNNFRIVMWDVLSCDFDRRLSPERCLRNTVKVVRPGSIIVFHDSLKAERNMTFTLPRLMDQLVDKGYSFKTISV